MFIFRNNYSLRVPETPFLFCWAQEFHSSCTCARMHLLWSNLGYASRIWSVFTPLWIQDTNHIILVPELTVGKKRRNKMTPINLSQRRLLQRRNKSRGRQATWVRASVQWVPRCLFWDDSWLFLLLLRWLAVVNMVGYVPNGFSPNTFPKFLCTGEDSPAFIPWCQSFQSATEGMIGIRCQVPLQYEWNLLRIIRLTLYRCNS